ncbi:MAG: DoxX family membrane protein [bacterium]|nr:DoxX family membrane protein [bacterium]
MNDSNPRDRLLRVGPLVLRLGVAAVLAFHGLDQVGAVFDGTTGQQASLDASGVTLSAGWTTVVGAAELLLAGLLGIGFFTRLATLPVLAGVAAIAPAVMGGSDKPMLSELTGAGPAEVNGLVLLLLAAVSVSLLCSGSGCLGIDSRRARRRREATVTA